MFFTYAALIDAFALSALQFSADAAVRPSVPRAAPTINAAWRDKPLVHFHRSSSCAGKNPCL